MRRPFGARDDPPRPGRAAAATGSRRGPGRHCGMSLFDRLRWIPILAFVLPALLLVLADRAAGRRGD